jgi:hypothetical protein
MYVHKRQGVFHSSLPSWSCCERYHLQNCESILHYCVYDVVGVPAGTSAEEQLLRLEMKELQRSLSETQQQVSDARFSAESATEALQKAQNDQAEVMMSCHCDTGLTLASGSVRI